MPNVILEGSAWHKECNPRKDLFSFKNYIKTRIGFSETDMEPNEKVKKLIKIWKEWQK
jgi:hypothetical protein